MLSVSELVSGVKLHPARMLDVFRQIKLALSVEPRVLSVIVELAVKAWATVNAPALLVVKPVRPSVIPLALVAPSTNVPVVPVADPVSIVMLPELLDVPNALPDCTTILLVLVALEFVSPL